MKKRKSPISRPAVGGLWLTQSQAHGPMSLAPDDLCDEVRRALAMTPVEAQSAFCESLLVGLQEAGVNVGTALLLLGIPATAVDELTPSDMGKLLRYVRLNSPPAIQALAEPLAQLLSVVSAGPALTAHKARKAA